MDGSQLRPPGPFQRAAGLERLDRGEVPALAGRAPLSSPPREHSLPVPGAARTLGEVVSGDGIHEGLTSKGDVTLKVSGQPVGWLFDKDVDLLVMRFAPVFLRRVAEENGLERFS